MKKQEYTRQQPAAIIELARDTIQGKSSNIKCEKLQ